MACSELHLIPEARVRLFRARAESSIFEAEICAHRLAVCVRVYGYKRVCSGASARSRHHCRARGAVYELPRERTPRHARGYFRGIARQARRVSLQPAAEFGAGPRHYALMTDLVDHLTDAYLYDNRRVLRLSATEAGVADGSCPTLGGAGTTAPRPSHSCSDVTLPVTATTLFCGSSPATRLPT
jgi:hypothetical protein